LIFVTQGQYSKLHILSRNKVLVAVILKMEAVGFLEVSVTVYQSIRHNILQNWIVCAFLFFGN